jgi:hypothetical protein
VRFFLALFLTLLLLPALTRADQLKHRQQLQEGISVTEIQSSAPAETAHIAKYYVDKAAPGSDYETGNLRIIYTDGTEVIEKIPPKEKSTEANTVYNQEGFPILKWRRINERLVGLRWSIIVAHPIRFQCQWRFINPAKRFFIYNRGKWFGIGRFLMEESAFL